MPKWITADQRTDEWLKSRLGVLTASRAADAFAVTKKGESELRRKYKMQLIAERLTNLAAEFYVNSAMQHGIDTEPAARERFEEITGLIVQECGFALHDSIPFFGASPDGLVGHDSLIEIKCPETATHLTYKMAGVPPEKYIPQMLVQLLVTGRKYCWFASYDDRVPAPNDIFIVKYEPTADELAEAEQAAMEFLGEVETMWEILTNQTEVQLQEAA